MKNLLNKMSIERLSEVPIEHLADRPTQAHKAAWFGYKYDKGWEGLGKTSPWKIASRIIEHNIGKSFDMAFSYYCKLVPQRYQKEFLKEFTGNCRRSASNYIIDENGNIQDNPENPWKGWYKRRNEYKGPYTFNSPDFKTELRHKITGHKKKDFEAVHEKKRIYITDDYLKNQRYYIYQYPYSVKLLYYEYGAKRDNLKPVWMRYKAQDSDFAFIIVQGWQKVFESKNDPEYKRLMAEKAKKSFISLKKQRIEQAEKAYDMISKTELKKKEEAILNKQNILRHGFDPISSFRGVQQSIV